MVGPITKGRKWVENILSGGVPNVTTDSVSTGEATITDPVTMFVRPTGSDTNDGLTAGTAKATVSAAIEDAPIHGDYSSRLTVDVDGTVPCDYDSRTSDPPEVKISGSGSGTATLDGGGTRYLLDMKGQKTLHLQGVTLDNGGGGVNLFGSTCHIDGDVVIQNMTKEGLFVRDNSLYTDTADTNINLGGGTTNQPVRVYDSVANLQGDYSGSGTVAPNSVCQVWAGGVTFIGNGATFTGRGTGTTDSAIDANDTSHVKTTGFNVNDCFASFVVHNNSQVKLTGNDMTETNIDRRWNIFSGGSASDAELGEEVTTVAKMNGLPTGMVDGNTGGAVAWLVLDQSDDTLKVQNGNGWQNLH